ncbi:MULTISPECIES: 50S ribosomal protein L6 [Asticcacaulis]|uniref:50S ribosomal protein L6 n=1 Tax=Asticcacaulis TaxID=76890 RepID=UPI001AEA5E48|nr:MULTISPECIES: 50S ribosomal protein L6 [Asticcacaulis]MBP2161814.1 large subunit ribosomal protein L6 [Asticcacaulis solisilvae]MDR6802860.1 large subunit ribosomal protein L6 [Asticcacaulis sp. BE141]
MSRIGKKAISVPNGVNITLAGQDVTVKGPKGQLNWKVVEEIEVRQEGNVLHISPRGETQRHKAMWGLSRTLIANMVKGVTEGYEVTLEMVGVGYRAAMQGQKLELSLGFSHPVVLDPPAGIKFEVPKQTEIKIVGIDKQAVGEMAAKVRKIRPPEPYKGKGVKYAGEKVRRKEGKKK